MDKLLNEFNLFFKGDARAEIVDGRLEITIGYRTLVIRLPAVIGVQAKGLS